MSRLAKLVVLVAALGLVVAGCNSVPSAAAGRSYKNPKNHFALDAPADWEQREDAPGFKVLLLAPKVGEEPQATVDVMVLPAAGMSDMAEYLALSRKAVSAYKEYKELQAKVVQHANGREACFIECEHERFGPKVRMKQYAMLCGGKQFIITASVPTDLADKLLPQADKILDSFYVW